MIMCFSADYLGLVYNVIIINMPSRWDSFNLLKFNTMIYIIV
jgi:hypothetical protein